MLLDGDVLVLEPQPQRPFTPAVAQRLVEVLRRALAIEVRHLRRGLLDIAEVGEEAANVCAEDRHSI